MPALKRPFTAWVKVGRLSLFEKVIIVNALLLMGEALVGLWVTSHSLESHHYLIDTTFIVLATVFSLLINFLLLRASFRPLFSLLQTIRAISAGQTQTRAATLPTDTEIGELAEAFNRMLDRLESIRREQAMLILQAQEEERRRVALELHDESSQNLTALLVHTEILQQSFHQGVATPEAQKQLRMGLQQLTELAQQTLEGLRVLALQLRPAVLDDLGLEAALRWLAEDCRQRLRLAIDLHIEALPGSAHARAYPPLYETTLFRVAQEGLTNVARHAQASFVSLSLVQQEQAISLHIQDNGQGYTPEQQRSGLGISGMRERVSLLNGTFALSTGAGKGTLVAITLPFPPTVCLPGETKDRIYA